MTTYYLDYTAVRALANVPASQLTKSFAKVSLVSYLSDTIDLTNASLADLFNAYDSDTKLIERIIVTVDDNNCEQVHIYDENNLSVLLTRASCKREFLQAKLARLESHVTTLSANLTKAISKHTLVAALNCLALLNDDINTIKLYLLTID